METVSIVIPTYNRAYCIERAVDSALAQSYPHLEVIVVDDGSTDGTAERLASRYSSERRFRYLFQENRGVSAARNTGLAAASGDYVALLDSDDIWKPWKIELQLRCLSRLPEAGMIWTDMEAIDPDGRVISTRYLRTMYSAYRKCRLEDIFERYWDMAPALPAADGAPCGFRLYCGDIFSPMMAGNLVHTSTVLMRRSRLQLVGGFDEGLKYSGEDYDFHLRTCLAGPVAFADVPSIQYQVGRADQLTQAPYQIHMARNSLRTVERMIEQQPSRIRLPPEALASVLARAHAWVGREALMCGNRQEARQHLARSLRFRFIQPATWGYLGLAAMPRFAFQWIRSAYRFVRSSAAT